MKLILIIILVAYVLIKISHLFAPTKKSFGEGAYNPDVFKKKSKTTRHKPQKGEYVDFEEVK